MPPRSTSASGSGSVGAGSGAASSSPSAWSTFSRAFTPAIWDDKEEFLDLIYWGRQIISVMVGIIWGYLGLTGMSGILSYILVTGAIVYLYSVRISLDNDDYMEEIKEGFMTSFSAFLVTWTAVYSGVYYS